MQIIKKLQRILLVGLIVLLTVSCKSSPNISHEYPQDPENQRKMRGGKLFSKDDEEIVLFGKKQEYVEKQEIRQEIQKTKSSKASFHINKKLWRASLEVISSMLPISLMDSNAGLVVTDWGTLNENNNERYKVNILVKGKSLDKDNVVVSVFKQKQKNRDWVNANTSGEYKEKIQTKILSRANQL